MAMLIALATPNDRPYHTEPAEVEATESFDSPTEEDFLSEYHRGPAKPKGQTWEQYWGWVQVFYKGNLLSEGWTKISDATLAVVKSDEQRRKVVKRINELGKIISREWAKDDTVRKIKTIDFIRWNDAMLRARRTDDGGGRDIMKALDTVRHDAEKLLEH
jgi:hypothetical protein